ncbi:CHAT domain-containing protein [Maridesulfovibrio sp. FT414]|uniref:CHAT domain-containing protein n=1 Tax=Maridesulfovibrio sp. FT414 TaxID=2979469 RepID=UPI003D8028DA
MKHSRLLYVVLAQLILFFSTQAVAAEECAWKKEDSLRPADFHAFVSHFKAKKKYNNLTSLLEHELALINKRTKNSDDEYAEIESRLYIMDDLAEVYSYGLVDFTKASEMNKEVREIYSKIKKKGLKELPISSYFNNYRFLYYTFYPSSFLSKSQMDFVFPDDFIDSIREADFMELGKRIEKRTAFINQKLGKDPQSELAPDNSGPLDYALYNSYVNLIDFSPEYSILERDYLKAQAAAPALFSPQNERGKFIKAILQTNSTAMGKFLNVRKEDLTRYCQMNYWLVLAQMADNKPLQALEHHKQLQRLITELDNIILSDYRKTERILRDFYNKELLEKNKTRGNTKSLLSGLAKVGVILAKAGLVVAAAAGDIAISTSGHASTTLTETAMKISLSGKELDWGAGEAVKNSNVLSPLDKLDRDNPEQLQKAMSPYALKLNRFLNKYEMINYLSTVGDAYARCGFNNEAFKQYDEAIRIVEQQRVTIQSETEKVNYFGLKERLYGKAVQTLVELKKLDQAFEYIERSKSRAFIDIIAGNEIELKDRTQEALSRTYTTNSLVMDSIYGAGDYSQDQLELVTKNFRGIKRLSSNVNENTVKEIYSLSNVSSINSEQAIDLIEPGTAIIEYYINGDTMTIITIKNTGINCIQKTINYSELCRDISQFNNSILKKQYGKSNARKLYDILIKPVQVEISKSKRLIIIPHKALHYLPFQALRSRQGYLILKHSISYSPSVTVLSIVERKPVYPEEAALIIGNPTKNLPFAEEESISIGKIVPKSKVSIGSNGTETMLKEQAGEYSIIHIATHGLFDSVEPMNSKLLLSPDDRNDGSLRATELFSCRWKASLVTLSACETGISKYNLGDELIGLQRAVFFAGTKSLLASAWKVDDKSTGYLMKQFYRYLKGNPKDVALQKAQIDTLNKYGRPYHWASFKLMGSPRRAFNPEYRVRIKTVPAEANVKIYGTSKRNTPYLRLPVGEYTINVSKKGYISRNETISVYDDKNIDIRLRRAPEPDKKKGKKAAKGSDKLDKKRKTG